MLNAKKQKFKTTVAGLALLSGLALSTTAFAEEVVLRSPDGTININGELLGFEDGVYLISSVLGEVRLSSSRVSCEGAACPNLGGVEADVAVAGSGTMGSGIMPILMSGYADSMGAAAEVSNTGTGETMMTMVGDQGFGDEMGSFAVSSTTDGDAFQALLDGDAAIGMSARRITVDEARALRDVGAGLMVSPAQERIVAIDNMVVVTHPSNEVGALTVEQLRGIFSGQITNWSEVGGADSDINVIAAQGGSTSHDFFMDYLFGEEQPDFLPQGIGASDQAVSNTVYFDRHAIGYVSFAFLQGTQPITLINECGIATVPDAFSAKTEEYELSRRMYMYSREDVVTEESAAFLDFAISEDADSFIIKSGFIDLGIARHVQDEDDPRVIALTTSATGFNVTYEGSVMEEMLDEMEDFDRLSSTFRFRLGSTRLDERGQLDMQRLISYLEDANDGTEVRFVGFTDDIGAFDANRELSQTRAAAVMDEIIAASEGSLGHIRMDAIGFGEIAPQACNISERGQAINRRVEVWITQETSS